MGVLTLLLGLAAVQAAALRGKEEMSENPIRRIVNLLQMMAKEVEEDGEKDEEMHEKSGLLAAALLAHRLLPPCESLLILLSLPSASGSQEAAH